MALHLENLESRNSVPPTITLATDIRFTTVVESVDVIPNDPYPCPNVRAIQVVANDRYAEACVIRIAGGRCGS